MKKTLMTMVILALAMGAFAETISGMIKSKKDQWKLAKETKSGGVITVANFDKADAATVAQYEGKQVEATGELNPASNFPRFMPGVQIKVVGE